MDFLVVTTSMFIVAGLFCCFTNCILKEDSKLFKSLEKLF